VIERDDGISAITRNKSSLSNGNKCQESQIKPNVQTKTNAVKDNLTHPKLNKCLTLFNKTNNSNCYNCFMEFNVLNINRHPN